MNRQQILDVLACAPPPGDAGRLPYIGKRCGQLFGWVSNPDQAFLSTWLPGAALRYPQIPMQIVEIGTFAGSTARGLIVLSCGGNCICVDNFVDMNAQTLSGYPDGAAYWNATVKGNGSDLSAFAELRIGDSGVLGEAFDDEIDLLLVDGSHDYNSCARDLRLWGAHVVPGGYLLLDDVDMPEVARAGQEFFAKSSWRVVRSPTEPTAKMLCMQRC